MMPARETERMMKLQDVILKAMARKLTWIQAAEIAGMSVRNMQRKRQAYLEYGHRARRRALERENDPVAEFPRDENLQRRNSTGRFLFSAFAKTLAHLPSAA
jgi:hypothetical protein